MNDKFLIHHFPNQAKTAAAAGESLNQLLMMYKKQPVLLMLSAGSALQILDYVGPSSLGKNLTVSVLDERFSQDQQINNFSGLQQTQFYTDALNANCNFLGTVPRNGESEEELAKRWEDSLIKWRDEHPNGRIIAILGMGPDGHTAGIFPLPEDADKFHQLFENEAWVIVYDVGNKHRYKERITTTLTFFKQIDEAVVFVCGEEKKEKFDKFTTHQGQPHELPALGWSEIKKIEIFTDIK